MQHIVDRINGGNEEDDEESILNNEDENEPPEPHMVAPTPEIEYSDRLVQEEQYMQMS